MSESLPEQAAAETGANKTEPTPPRVHFVACAIAAVVMGVPLLLCSGVIDLGTEGRPAELSDADLSASAQADRRRLIAQYTDLGYLERVELVGTTPYVWVAENFASMEARDRNLMLGVIFAFSLGEYPEFCNAGFVETIKVKYDDASAVGQTLGRYEPVGGFR